MNGIKKWNRSTEPLKNNVFHTCSRGYSNRDAASESGINQRCYSGKILPSDGSAEKQSQEEQFMSRNHRDR